MKKIPLVLTALLLAIFTWHCEKDDICDANTPTTPRLIMEFYDISNPSVLKNVANLKIQSPDIEDPLIVLNGKSKVELPLSVMEDFTEYIFVLNSTNPDIDNTDIVRFNYIRENVFVSRACGYKTLFALDQTTPFTQTDNNPTDQLWMQNITVTQANIETENETHIKVYF